jgi:hypothetical protein
MSTANNVNDLEPEKKWMDSAQTARWNIKEFQEMPISVDDWNPYIQQFATKGILAVWPDPLSLAPYLQAMNTAGFNPTFVTLSSQFYAQSTIKAMTGLHLPPM